MTRPATPLRVLLVEDSEDDAVLLLRELRRGGYEPLCERVSTPEEMERALQEASGRPWQIVIADYYMPRFRAPDALALLRRLGYDTPFVIVSGKIGEEAAVTMLRAGAQDYVSKENMVRLCPVIERELREAEGRRERERVEEALHFLSEASAEFSSSLDYRVTLAGVARLAVPRLADWCAVDILEEDGSTSRLAVEHEDPAKVALALELQERYPPSPDAPSGVPNVIGTGRPEFYAEITGEMVEAAARDEEHLRILREIGFTSAIIVPMIAREKTLGAITLVSAESGRRYGEADLELAEELARRAALAVDNARLYAEAQKEIAERERAREELRDSRDQLEVILRGVNDGITAQDPSGHLVYANEAAARIVGYPTAKELLGAPLEEVMCRFEVADESGRPLPPDELPGRRALQGEEAGALLRFREVETGEERWSVVSATPVFDERGRVRFAVNIFRDITERKRVEEALRQNEERYRTFIEQSTEGIWRFELEEPVSPDLPEGDQIEHFYRHAYLAECNDAMAAMYGYERAEEIVGARLEDFLPRTLPANVAYLEAFVRSGYSLTDVESHEVDREGNAKYFLNNLTGIVENGLLVRAWGTQRDVTERKRAEEEHARLAAIVESSEDAILGKTLDGTITSWNHAAERLYGYSVDEAVGRPVTMLVPPDRPEEVPEILRKVRRGEKVERLETVRVSKAGRRLDVSLTVSPIRNPEGDIVGASTIARDITERRRAEAALREAREAERNRIARDLHDDILQDIVYALQEIQIVQVISEDGGSSGLEEAAEALRRSVEGLRGAVFELRLRETLGRSFVSTLEGLLDLSRRMARRSYELELIVEDGFPRVLSERASRELVRIVQEALANVRRHAEARHARVRLWREGDLAHVEVADDGRGFDAENPGVGVGQQSMRHRAQELGGELAVESQPGRGTRVRFEAPVSRLVGG
jgi:PAS domain S-box-containing protein